MTPAPALAVASELRRRLPAAGTVKIHKLLYYSQGHHLATFGRPLFPETISAWDMGPVVGELWFDERARPPTRQPTSGRQLTEAELNSIGYVVSRYGALSGLDLQHLTHQEDPWLEANRRRPPSTSARIAVESMRSYFSSSHDADRDDEATALDVDQVTAWLDGAQERVQEPSRLDDLEELRTRATR